MRKPIYLDYAATTPVAPEVAKRMAQCLTMDGIFANPASRAHLFGWQAEEAVESARAQVADLIGADTREIVFTSGATESNNLAIKGLALARQAQGKHIVTSCIEHKAVLDTCLWLQANGFEVTYLKPRQCGRISLSDIEHALRPDTVLVSVMHVNNEVGAINPIAEVGELCRARGIGFHVDAAQSIGKLVIDVDALKVDLLSISAHKIYGPKGIGALYVRRAEDIAICAQIHGGGHERGMRSGTLATHQIVGLGEALAIAGAQLEQDQAYLERISQMFLQGIKHWVVRINGGDPDDMAGSKVPGILNISFGEMDGEQLLFALQGVAVSTGSACTSTSIEPSYVLKALGLSDALAHGSLRFSFGRYTSIADIELAITVVNNALKNLKR